MPTHPRSGRPSGPYPGAELRLETAHILSRPPGVTDNAWAIFEAARGATYAEAGQRFGVSKQRVHKVVCRVRHAAAAAGRGAD